MKKSINLEKEKIENQSIIRVTGLIILGIIGLMTLIGAFFGKDGFEFVGLSLGVFIMFLIAMGMVWGLKDY